MEELHWYGADDETILPAWTRAYCQRFQTTCIAAHAQHTAGWLEQWQTVLNRSREIFAEERTGNRE